MACVDENSGVPYADTPLTDEIRRLVSETWDVDATVGGERLFGGEESAAFQIGDLVIRVGPTWRTTAELEWCHRIADAAARDVPEVVAPLRTKTGETVRRVGGHPVSLWPHIEGTWVDDSDDHQVDQAANLLARLHQSLASISVPDRPASAGTVTTSQASGDDPDLERWLDDFDSTRRAQPIHGDFYAGNMLACGGTIVGLLDWDEAILSPPTRELAWAAWEFGDGLWADDLTDVWGFITAYKYAGGPAEPPDDLALRNLVRQRLLGEMRYIDQQATWTDLTDDDLAYRRRQEDVCKQLEGP